MKAFSGCREANNYDADCTEYHPVIPLNHNRIFCCCMNQSLISMEGFDIFSTDFYFQLLLGSFCVVYFSRSALFASASVLTFVMTSFITSLCEVKVRQRQSEASIGH